MGKVRSLSQLSLYFDSDPETASQVAKIYGEVLNRPEIKQALIANGQDPAGLLDGALTPSGIGLERSIRDSRAEGLTQSLQRAASRTLEDFGLDRPLNALLDKIVGESADRPKTVEATPESSKKDIPIIGRADPAELLGRIGMGLVPMAGAMRGIQGVQAAQMLPKVLADTGARFAGTFGGLEAARQVGRNLAHGEKINPTAIGVETVIGAASGTPFTGGQLKRRLLSAALPAATAGSAQLLLGDDAGIDGTRVATEALFGALLPPKASFKASGPLGPAAIDQTDMLSGALARLKREPIDALMTRARQRMANLSPEKLDALIKEGGSIEGPVFKEVFDRRSGVFTSASNPLTGDYLRARLKIVKEMSLMEEGVLRKAVAEGGVSAQAASDALALKLKATRPVEAPANVVIDGLVKEVKQVGTDTPDLAFKVEAENTLASEIRVIGNRQKIASIRRDSAVARDTVEQLEKNIIKANRSSAALPGANLQQLSADLTAPRLKEIKIDLDTGVREALFPKASMELADTEARIIATKRDIDLTGGEATDIQARVLRDLTEIQQNQASSINETLNKKIPIFIEDAGTAKSIAEDMALTMSPSQVKHFASNLPQGLKKFETQVKSTLESVAQRKFNLEPAETKRAINFERQANNLRVFKEDLQFSKLKGSSFRQLEKGLSNTGLKLAKVKGGFQVTGNGSSVRFKTKAQVRSYLDNVLGPNKVTDSVSMDIQAGRKFVSLSHIGNGRMKSLDLVSGESQMFDSPAEAAKALEDIPVKIDEAPNLLGDNTPELAVAPSGNTAQSSNARAAVGFRGPKPEPGKPVAEVKNLEDMPDIIFDEGFIRTSKELFLDIESNFNDIPVFTQLLDPMFVSSNMKSKWVNKPMGSLRKMLSGVDNERMGAIQDTLIATGPARNVMVAHHRLSGEEVRVVDALERWYGERLELNPEGVAEFFEGMGKFRESFGDPHRLPGLGNAMLPRTMEFLRSAIEDGRFRPGGTNAAEVATSLLHEMGNDKFGITDLMARGDIMASELTKRAKLVKGGDRAKVQAMSQIVSRYQSIIGDRADLSGQVFSDGVDRIFVPLLRKMSSVTSAITSLGQRLVGITPEKISSTKFVKGDTFTKTDLDKLSSMGTTWYSGIAMSARAALVTRNFFQSMLPATKVGFGPTIRGMKKAMNMDGPAWEQARKAGVLDDAEGLLNFKELEAFDAGFFRKAMKLGLQPYRKIDSFNRVASYFAGRATIEDAAENFLRTGDKAKFLLDTGAANDSHTIRNQLTSLVQNRGVDAAADFYGRHIMQDTQFIYQRWNLPKIMGGVDANQSFTGMQVGKMFGQFGVWPTSFHGFIRRNVFQPGMGETSLANRSRLRFLRKWSILVGGMGLMGAATGVDTSTWNAGNMWNMEGGPAYQILGDVATLIQSGSPYETQIAESNVRRFAAEAAIPFGGLLKDLRQAEGEQGIQAILTALGFNLQEN